ncbi:DUF6334 family protein [Nannocystis exedens]|uniref:DUF6334 family protein n=1 Tax=Nannocystis exedens TaxID=54 RepID=UPI001B805EA6|nr:DUF6334 family protein [Nannocystis exedens]
MMRDETSLEAVSRIIDSGLPLTSVEFCMDSDLPSDPVAFRFSFEDESFCVSANGHDDTIIVSRDMPNEYASYPSRAFLMLSPPWNGALGAKLIWVWTLENQRGYFDGIQLQFEHLDSPPPFSIQMIALASTLRVFHLAKLDFTRMSQLPETS